VPLVAVYTGCAQQAGADGSHRQNQQLAFSLDRGRCWTKFAGNPVLDLGSGSFRDPKVFWHAATARWIMLVSKADEGVLCFFGSPDLRTWQPLGEFRQELPGCSVWECPDLLELAVEGESGTAWLLKWDVFHGHPGGGSGALGVVGGFDGTRFEAWQAPQWLDGGMDFYAAIAFGAMPPGDARRVWLGWMNSHHYAQHTPTDPWRGAMTLPRELTLTRVGGRLQVAQRPVRELQARRGPVRAVDSVRVGSGASVLVPSDQLPIAWELEIAVEACRAGSWALCLAHGEDEESVVTIEVHRAPGMLSLTRGPAGLGPSVAGFFGTRRMPWAGAEAAVAGLQVVVDACSIEVFAADGTSVLTEQIFPRQSPLGLRLRADREVRLRHCRWWPLDG
jgi:fructan beta-fructosidase